MLRMRGQAFAIAYSPIRISITDFRIKGFRRLRPSREPLFAIPDFYHRFQD